MNKDIEIALRTLNEEFRSIKRSLDPISEEFKKIKVLEIELSRLKSDISPKLKKLELDIRRKDSQMPARAAEKSSIANLKNIETQINKIKTELILLKKGPRVDKEQDSMLRGLSENQDMIDRKLKDIIKNFEEKYKNQINTNRKIIVELISENNQLKKRLEKQEAEVEKTKKDMEIFQKGFQERDKNLTKEMNTRRRHINQIVEELNEARKKAHLQGTIVAENKEKIDSMKVQVSKLSNNLDNIEKAQAAKIDRKEIEDTKLEFSRLDKRTITNIGEIKARMRELERKIVGRKEIDNISTIVQELQTKHMNRLKIDFADVSKKMDELPKHIEDKLSNLKRVMAYIDKLKKDTDILATKTENLEFKQTEIDKLKASIHSLSDAVSRIKMPKEDLDNAIRYVDVVKKDHLNLKREQEALDQRFIKLSEKTADIDILKSIKADVAKAITKSEKVSSVVDVVEKINDKLAKIEAQNSSDTQNLKNEMDRINIKVESTSKILKDLEKVL